VAVPRALPALLGLLAAACDDGGYLVVIHVPGDPARLVRVEVALIRSCSDVPRLGDAPTAPLRVVEAGPGRPKVAVGSVAAGSYALYARAWQHDCELYAVGCQAQLLEGGGEGTLQVFTTPIDPEGCLAGERCVEDVCRPALRDAGPSGDAGPALDAEVPVDAAPPDAAVPVECPAEYEAIDGSRYRFVQQTATWLEAELDCEDDARGAHLIIVDDVDEHYVLHDLTQGIPDAWIGYTDRVREGQFAWLAPGGLDPGKSACYWGPGGVINGERTDCVVQGSINACGDWFVYDCETQHGYVCECDDQPADRAAY